MKIISAFVITFFLICFSLFLSYQSVYTDFPVYYAAAKTILAPGTAKSSVYDTDMPGRYPIPEPTEENNVFIYSMPVAYLFAPLALMPYFIAKATMIFINIVLYVTAIALILRYNRSSGRWSSYPLLLSWVWIPYVQGIRTGQVDAIMLFLVTLAGLSATKNRNGLPGILLAIAALFKLFPFAIAMLLGLKNWRIPVYCALCFGAFLLMPGSLKWFMAIRNIYTFDFMPTYLLLKKGSLAWIGLLYFGVIVGYTAATVYRFRYVNHLMLIAFAIPAVFLIMPIVEYHHLTLLIFSYVYLLNPSNKDNRWLLLIALLSFVLIDVSYFISRQSYLIVMPLASKILIILGLLMSWSAMAWKIHVVGQRTFPLGRPDETRSASAHS